MVRGMDAYCELPGWECPTTMSDSHSGQEFSMGVRYMRKPLLCGSKGGQALKSLPKCQG